MLVKISEWNKMNEIKTVKERNKISKLSSFIE